MRGSETCAQAFFNALVFGCYSLCILSGNDARVYEFVVRHFLACCSKDAQGHETVVDIDINSEKVNKISHHKS